MSPRTRLLALLALSATEGLAPAGAQAVQLALESVKQDRGIVAFVDMRRVYEAYPQTRREKEAFEAEVLKRQKLLVEQQARAKAVKLELDKLEDGLSKLLSEPLDIDTSPVSGVFEGLMDIPGLNKALTPAPMPKIPQRPPEPPRPNPFTYQSPEAFARLKQVEAQLTSTKAALAASEADLRGLEKRLDLEKEITRMKGERGLAAWGRAAELLQEIMKLYPEDGGKTLADISIPETVKSIKSKRSDIEADKAAVARLDKERRALSSLPPGQAPKPAPPPPTIPPYQSGISTASIAEMISAEAKKRAELAQKALEDRSERFAGHLKKVHELEEKIDQKRAELAAAKDELQSLGVRFGKELLDLEDQKTLSLLSSLYKLTRELAVEERASMVMDKGVILYGSQSVDLTDKLLQRLKERL